MTSFNHLCMVMDIFGAYFEYVSSTFGYPLESFSFESPVAAPQRWHYRLFLCELCVLLLPPHHSPSLFCPSHMTQRAADN